MKKFPDKEIPCFSLDPFHCRCCTTFPPLVGANAISCPKDVNSSTESDLYINKIPSHLDHEKFYIELKHE